MSEITGIIGPGALSTVDSRSTIDINTRAFDDAGNEYIYLQGVANCSAGSWVTFDEDGKVTLLAANAVGPVAVAKAAIIANKSGWFCIYGTVDSWSYDDINDNAVALARSVFDGYVGEGATAGDIIYGVIARSSIAADLGRAELTVQIYYPFVDDQTGAH